MPNPAPTKTGETLGLAAPVIAAKIYPSQVKPLETLIASSDDRTTSGLIRRLLTEELDRQKISS